MTEKETWFIVLEKNIHLGKDPLWEVLIEFPSIQFGVEMAFQSLAAKSPFLLFPSEFTEGLKSIHINGLVWMGEEAFMKEQIEEKLKQGFHCIKLKIGAIDFDKELQLLSYIREHFGPEKMEIRVDANGAFDSNEALDKISQLSEFKLHSIEQPIEKSNTDRMAELCKKTPLPIALDEELIGVFAFDEKEQLLQKVKPQYIILKPSFIGGFRGTQQWISLAEKHQIRWWITSALESNIGLNAIAQWTYLQQNLMPQGLGTGALYTNNFDCPLEVSEGQLWYKKESEWKFSLTDIMTLS
jgi:o-succinylbenzoate synthase